MLDTKIALVQMQSKLGCIKENLDKINGYVTEAAASNVDIVCFPEMCITGYGKEVARELAVDLDTGQVNECLREMSTRNNIVLITGLAERNNSEKPYITQVVVKPDGLIKKYRKTHMGKSEKPYFAEGNVFEVFEHEKCKFSIQICWDMHFPEMTAILSLRGAELVFAPHASPVVVGDRRGIWLKYLSARAYDNAVFVAACNLIGDDGQGGQFCGGAIVIDPKGNVLDEDFNGRESMLVVELKADKINKIRGQRSSSMANSFYLMARRPELYTDLIKKPK